MANFSETVAYRGIPVGFEISGYVEWEDFAPMAGSVQRHTVVYGADDGDPAGPSYYYDEKKTLETLRELAGNGKFYQNLIDDAQGLYDRVADKVPMEQFNPETPAQLSEKDRQAFIDVYLSPAGLEWTTRKDEDSPDIIEYITNICSGAEIPFYNEDVMYMHDGINHRILGFSVDGREFSTRDNEVIQAGLKDFHSYVNGSIFDIRSPTSDAVIGIPDSRGLKFDDPDSCVPIKEIEADINSLINNKNGDYSITVPYAHSPKSSSDRYVTFDPDKKITLRVKTLREATDLAIYWSEFGQSVEPHRIKEKE